MRRREFITLLGGAAAAPSLWPLAARAQQAERVRRVAILMPYLPTDTEWRQRVDVLQQELQKLGWTRGRNIEFDERWTTDNLDLVRANAANLVELKPDAIVAGKTLPLTDHVYSVAFSPDGSLVAAGSYDGEVRVWKVADGSPVTGFNASPGQPTKFSPSK